MAAYGQQRSTSRLAALAVAALLHAVVVYALINGMGHKVVEALRQPFEAKVVVEVKPPPPPPPPPPPQAPKPKAPAPKPSYVPPPLVRAAQPAPAAITAVTETRPTEEAKPAPPAPPAPEPVRVGARLDAGASCKPPQYPSLSRRNGEAGAVTLKFLINIDGSVAEGLVEASSGHARLDDAALQALSLCRFTPGSVDGKPEKSWARMRYVWKLN